MLSKLVPRLRWLVLFAGGWLLSLNLSAQQNASRFGVVEGFWFPDKTCEMGVGWERIIFDWAQHQPGSAEDWHTLNVDDRWLKAASSCNREVVAVIKHTPAWATDGATGVGVPRGLHLPFDDPDNLWAAFIHRMVDYYASRGVNHFILWNEPDISSDTYGYEFEGSLEDYFQMLKTGYLAAKSANPAAVIHLAGTTYWHDVNAGRKPYIERLIERILQDPEAAKHHQYFDILSLHIYFRTDTVYEITRVMRDMLDRFGLSEKSIWINETNAAPTDDPSWPVMRPVYQLDLEMQAAFLVQSAALGLAAGAERIAAYKLYDQALPAGGESFGLLSPVDASPRPAYHAWKMVVEQFSDVSSAKLAQTDTLSAVLLTHGDGRQSLVAWARTDRPAQLVLSAANPKSYLLDQYGKLSILRPDQSQYSLILPGAVCNAVDGCFLGGAVQIIVFPIGEVSAAEMVNNQQTALSFE